MRTQIGKLLEHAVANLPEALLPVFVLREIEGLSVEETAEALEIPTGTVKTRLLRSRHRLQRELDPEIREALHSAFPFCWARLRNAHLGRTGEVSIHACVKTMRVE